MQDSTEAAQPPMEMGVEPATNGEAQPAQQEEQPYRNSADRSDKSLDRRSGDRRGRSSERRGSRDRLSSRDRRGGGSRERRDRGRHQVYVAGITRHISKQDLEEEFGKFGPINDTVMKRGYAFIVSIYPFKRQEFDNQRDADDAIKELNGKQLRGDKLVVEVAGTVQE